MYLVKVTYSVRGFRKVLGSWKTSPEGSTPGSTLCRYIRGHFMYRMTCWHEKWNSAQSIECNPLLCWKLCWRDLKLHPIDQFSQISANVSSGTLGRRLFFSQVNQTILLSGRILMGIVHFNISWPHFIMSHVWQCQVEHMPCRPW